MNLFELMGQFASVFPLVYPFTVAMSEFAKFLSVYARARRQANSRNDEIFTLPRSADRATETMSAPALRDEVARLRAAVDMYRAVIEDMGRNVQTDNERRDGLGTKH